MNDHFTQSLIVFIIIMMFAIPLHEFGHALAAHLSGDDVPSMQGRVTMEPWKHWDPIGGFLIAIGIFSGAPVMGWGKPVQTDPRNYKNGRLGMLIVATAGILVNLALAMIGGIIYRTIPAVQTDSFFSQIVIMFVFINVMLALFNLLPIPPLDGSKIVTWFLPVKAAMKFERATSGPGFFIIFALVIILPRLLPVGTLSFPMLWLSAHILGISGQSM